MGTVCTTTFITIIVNLGVPAWNDRDVENLHIAERRCAEKFGANSPCLKRFRKIGELEYEAICGKAE